MVLVVDPESLRVISSSIGMYNLMEHHVSIVEDLMKKRAPFRDQAVLYFVEPNEQSISKVIEDWTPEKGKRGPLYGDTVFLYFLGRLPDELFGKIKECKELVKRVKVLKEVNLDFLTKEAGAFHFDMGKDTSIYSDLYLSAGGGRGRDAIARSNDIQVGYGLCNVERIPTRAFPGQEWIVQEPGIPISTKDE